jgi:hypothetical protein
MNAVRWPSPHIGRGSSGAASCPKHTTAASILDRLLHHASIVITSGQSYRMRHADHRNGTLKS